jgi:glucose/arabinose dehydrogenase
MSNGIAQIFTALSLACLVCSTHLDAQEAAYPPGTFQLAPEIDLQLEPVPVEVPTRFSDAVPDNVTLNLPPGFSAKIFALDSLQRPRFMAFSPEGVLYVADMRGGRTKDSKQTRIVAFPDRDGDGVADEAIVVADQLSYAHSLAFYRGDLYVAETHQIVRFRDGDGDGIYDEPTIFVTDIPDIPPNGFHGTRTIVFDEINEKIYLGVGSPCDLCRDEEPVAGTSTIPIPTSPEWGTILQFNADGTGRRVFARGIRNAIGMALHPLTNQLWATHNHYDLGGSRLPPEWIDIIRDGGFYGFPFAFGYQQYVDFSVEEYKKILPITGQDSLRVQSMRQPVALVPAHLAPMAIHFYIDGFFPTDYHNAAFVALRGGRSGGNLAVVPGFKVVALFSEPDGSNARIADFLTGFQRGNTVWGKPVGLTTDAQGNLYVSSDVVTPAIIKIAHSPISGSWEHGLPDAIVVGTVLDIDITVHLDRFVEEGEAPTLRADLSALGGLSSVPLEAVGDGTFRLQIVIEIDVPTGVKELLVRIEQDTPLGFFETKLAQLIKVVPTLPTADLSVLADGLGDFWAVEHNSRIALADSETVAYQGQTASAFEILPALLGGWNVQFLPDASVDQTGYRALHFAFHPGTMTVSPGSTFIVSIAENLPAFVGWPRVRPADVRPARRLDLLGGESHGIAVDIDRKDWQVVEIPLDFFEWPGSIEKIEFSGTTDGTFYLDDIRFLVDIPPISAVLETHNETAPQSFSLDQNFPNPFNSSTAIRFTLPVKDHVELSVYNLNGQKVGTLVEGLRLAGIYTVYWDGRDDRGRQLASGLYLYRLRAGTETAARKLLLLQ